MLSARQEENLLHIRARVHEDAGGARRVNRRAALRAGALCEAQRHARARHVHRRRILRQEHHGSPSLPGDAGGDKIRHLRRLHPRVQAEPFRTKRRRLAQLPATHAGLRHEPHMREGRHQLRGADGQDDDCLPGGVRGDGTREHHRADVCGARAEGPRGQMERRAGPLRIQARQGRERRRPPGD